MLSQNVFLLTLPAFNKDILYAFANGKMMPPSLGKIWNIAALIALSSFGVLVDVRLPYQSYYLRLFQQ